MLSDILCFNMTYKKIQLITWIAALILPLCIHTFIVFVWAKGGYDGKNCAGLLDAVWECSEFEYYIDYIFNPVLLVNLIVYYLIAFFVALILVFFFKK